MPQLSPASQAVIDEFGQQPDVTADQLHNLRAAIDASPALTVQFNDAVAQGHLRHIEPLIGDQAGGAYKRDDQSMHLPLSALTTGSPYYNPGGVIFVLGHELQHGFNDAAIQKAKADFEMAANAIAKGSSAMHDYTAPVAGYIAARRCDEADAEIAGWNAVVAAVRAENTTPSLEDIYEKARGRMRDFIEKSDHSPYTYTLRPNLKLNDDLTLSPTTANVEAMGKNYFDKPAEKVGLGHYGNSDYANENGAYAISRAAQLERFYNPPVHGVDTTRMAVDMAQLKLDRKLLEENGINLGRDPQPMPFQDLSTTPPTLQQFHHTAQTHTYVPSAASVHTPDAAAQERGGAPQQDSRFFPPTATDKFLEAYCHAAQQGDNARCAALTEQHMQQPHMQAQQLQGQQLYEAQLLLQQQEELRRQEQARQQALQEQQQQQAQAHSRGFSM